MTRQRKLIGLAAVAVTVAAWTFVTVRASSGPALRPSTDPEVTEVGELTAGREEVIEVQVVNPSRRVWRLRGSGGLCQGNICVWQEGGRQELELPPGLTPFPVRLAPKYPGPFDVTFEVYVEAGGQLVTVPIHLVGTVVADGAGPAMIP